MIEDTGVLACKTLEDELRYAAFSTGVDYPIRWIESGLHEMPAKLNMRLQELLDVFPYKRVLLVMGFCGNSVLGIRTGTHEVIMARVEDCISLLLGSSDLRSKASQKNTVYFLTEGWLRGERSLWAEYQYIHSKYEPEQARWLLSTIYGHYQILGLLDTKTAQIEPLIEDTKKIAEAFGMAQEIVPASTSYIEDLLRGPWDEKRFLVKHPGSIITTEDLTSY